MNGFLTVREVADKWNMSVRNIQNLCAAGKLEGAVKFGNAEGGQQPEASDSEHTESETEK